MVRNLLVGAAALGLMATPAVARPPVTSANPAAKLSLSNAVPANARASTKSGRSKLAGGGLVVAAIAAVAVITGIVIVSDDDSDSN